MPDMGWIGPAVKTITDIGFVGLFLLILITGYKGIWVWGRNLDEIKQREKEAVAESKRREDDMRRERDTWQQIALRGTHLADRAVSLVQTAVTKTE